MHFRTLQSLSILCCCNSIPQIIIHGEYKFILELRGLGNRILRSRCQCLTGTFFLPPCMAKTEGKKKELTLMPTEDVEDTELMAAKPFWGGVILTVKVKPV